MQRHVREVGGIAAGCTVGGLLTGLAEGLYRGASVSYTSFFYGASWAVVGALLAAILGRVGRVRDLPQINVGLSTALGASTLVLGRFVLLRDVFHEAPGKGVAALIIATAAALAVMGAVQVGSRFVRKRFIAEKLRARWAWLVPLAAVLIFAVKTRAHDDATSEEPPAAARPLRGRGVILVVVDALRADALGAYGAKQHRGEPPSPAVDDFAKNARVFADASAQASWTRPAMASLLTSRHVSGHGTMAKNAVLPEELPTLAAVLRERGVATAAVVTNYNLEPAYGFARGFTDYRYLAPARYLGAPEAASRLAAYNTYRLVRERFFASGREARYFYRSARAVNAQALGILDAVGDGDFFLYLHYMEPHDPYFAEGGASFARVSDPKPPLEWAPRMRDAYGDEVRRFDAAFGELLAALAARGLADRVTVVVTADHGEELGEHGGFYHGLTLYEEQLHVPLIVGGPGVSAGVSTELAREIDVAPTILGRFGAKAPDAWEGRDLLAGGPPPALALAEEEHEGNVLAAVRRGTRKLIVANADNPRGLAPLELYDLATDRDEKHNLGDREVGDLRAALDAAVAAAKRGGVRAGVRAPDAATEAELRSLGYVQ